MKNAHGNLLDATVIDRIKALVKPGTSLTKEIIQIKRKISDKRQNNEIETSQLMIEINENQEKIKALVNSLCKAKESSAEKYIIDKIENLHNAGEALQEKLNKFKKANSAHIPNESEIESTIRMLSKIPFSIEGSALEQKRALLRSLVSKIIWDGENANLYLIHNIEINDIYTLPNNISDKNKNTDIITSDFRVPLGEDSE